MLRPCGVSVTSPSILLHVSDDVMEGTELAVRDVADLLHAQYAIVTGKLQCRAVVD
jgi:hypothetical protein